MSGWSWFFTIAAVVVVIAVALFMWLFVTMDRFVERCMTVLSYHTFMTPCEIARAHAERYGVEFGDIAVDADMVADTFDTVEEVGLVVGQDHVPDEHCGCLRAYRLTYRTTRRRRRIFSRPSFEWIGGLAPRPV